MSMFHRAGLILCLSAILVSAEKSCPFPEEIEPCTCILGYYTIFEIYVKFTLLKCSKVYDTQVLLRVFDNARQFRFDYFRLEESILQYIPHQIFDDVVVNKLYLTNVTLRTMFDEVPRDPEMYWLTADRVKILGGWDWKMLAVFKNLKRLYISNMPLKKLTTDSLSNIKNLPTLFCMNCEIRKLEDNVFADFTYLKYINLAHNAIVDIKRTMFPRNIQHINLEYNKISTLPIDIFTDMPSLGDVELAGNMLAVLPEGPFQPVISQLALIDVRENPIKCDCRIKWVLQLRSGAVKGNCYTPKAIHDKPLDQLTQRDIRC